ncbi:growth factor receptor-bound protein 7-like isoform X2 [Nerophis ophidion]|uniref:growth factor receptor-bound protein 7-like isoform X2 n=1 Tax=Nerophis ophidion TaxID=159077 RepID=UPI002AE0878F|nr:growth factor receptor-bound protein 7-like isoform X2 [Nerophis ophidion]
MEGEGSSVVRRSQPIAIASNRFKGAESLSSSAPAIPNPFPELCSPSHSPVTMATLTAPSSDRHLLKVFGEDHRGRSLWVGRTTTAREVCRTLVRTAGCGQQEDWTLLECHPALGLERCLEDHEVVLEVQASWSLTGDSRLLFCKNYAKDQVFCQPALFFPQHMISANAQVGEGMTSSQLVQDLLGSGACPEIQGFLHTRESKSWRKICYFLRPSGLYCSTKGASKEAEHLRHVAHLQHLQVYKVLEESARVHAAPSRFCFCLTLSRGSVHLQDGVMMCADSDQSRTCWMSAFRLFKAKSEASLVAMELSGKSGRVLQSPSEVESAERAEGQGWRRTEALRCSLPNLSSASRASCVHLTRPWFHGGVSRKEAHRLMEKQGLVDGMFLVRDSQQHEDCFVLSLCYQLTIKHFLVIPCEEQGRKYVTMDDGASLFLDLHHMIHFHLLNKGVLPVCLSHPCVCLTR